MSETTEKVLSEDEIEAVRVLARAAIGEIGSVASAAKESGIAYATFAAWVSAKYAGRSDRVAMDVQKWLNTRRERSETLASAPTAPGFILTETADSVLAVLRQAQHMPDFCVITGAPGVGKTTAACRYTRETANVFKITANPSLRMPRDVLTELSRLIGLPGGGMLHMQHRALVNKLRGIRALVVVDEANHLSSEALDQLRSIHDEAECGLALLGNARVFSRLEGGTRTAEFAQLFSRVGVRLAAKTRTADADALIDAWGIDDKPRRDFLRVIARKPGALRALTKTLKLAHIMASGERAAVSVEHLRMAWAQLGNGPLTEAA
jgi:DNA transposition AAA+ family ATPase